VVSPVLGSSLFPTRIHYCRVDQAELGERLYGLLASDPPGLQHGANGVEIVHGQPGARGRGSDNRKQHLLIDGGVRVHVSALSAATGAMCSTT